MSIVERARKLAQEKHDGQVDKANQDYFIAHVEVVAKKVENAGYPIEYVVTAYLHDIVEDTDVTVEELADSFGNGIASAVAVLSKAKGEHYGVYIKKIQQNKIATVVKYYDMEHNSDLGRLEKIKNKDIYRKEKYLENMNILYETMEKKNMSLELKDLMTFYHTKMYIQAEYSKIIWKRFNWFLAIEAGIFGLYFAKGKVDSDLIVFIPFLGLFIAFLWFIMGCEDQRSAQSHKEKGKQIENIILNDHLNLHKDTKEKTFLPKQTNILWLIPILTGIAWSLILLVPGYEKKTEETVVNVGAIFPMTGGAAVYGKYFSNGANLAILNAVKEGRITNEQVKLIIADGQAKSVNSLSAFKKLSQKDDIQALMIDLSSVILAVKPQLNKNKIPSINSSSFGSDIEDADDYMFSILPNAKVYAEKIAEYSYTELHKKSAAVVYRNDAMGLSFLNSFKRKFEELGGKVTFVETHKPGETEYALIAQKLKNTADVDVVFLASYGVEAARLVKRLSEYDYKNTYITFQGFLIPKVFEVAGSATEGVYIIASGFSEDDAKVAKLKTLLNDEIGSNDFNYYVAAHYDAMNMIIKAIEEGHTTREQIRNYIAQIKNFEGITGVMNFDDNGLADLPLSAYIVNNSKFLKL